MRKQTIGIDWLTVLRKKNASVDRAEFYVQAPCTPSNFIAVRLLAVIMFYQGQDLSEITDHHE